MYNKIAIRGGHTFSVPGAHGIIDETTEDRKVAKDLISILRSRGKNVLDVTPPDSCNTQSLELRYGVNKANNWGADLFISLHFNAAFNYIVDKAMGTEVCVAKYDKIGEDIAKNVSSLGFTLRHPEHSGQLVSPRGLYEIRHTRMTAVIIEPCFVESSIDVAVYKKIGHYGLALAIAKAILEDESINLNSLVNKNPGKWVKYNNRWSYKLNNGNWAMDCWIKDNNNYFLMDKEGYTITGWASDSGKWYYFYSNGVMATGWIKSISGWYYLNPDGSMATGWLKDSKQNYYYLNKDGKMVTGYNKINGVLYYFYGDGIMAHDCENLYGYKINSSGKCTRI